MSFQATIKGKKYKVNVSAERWSSLQRKFKSRQVPTPEQIVPEKEKERGWLTSPISPKISEWVKGATEPEEDDWYATRVGKRIGRVLGEDINSPLGAGITGLAALAGPLGWAARAGRLGAGALKVASSAGAAKVGKAATVGFGALGVSQTPELLRSGGEFLETKSPESLGDTLISGAEVGGGGYLLGSAARRARRAKKPAEAIVDKVFGEEKPSPEPSLPKPDTDHAARLKESRRIDPNAERRQSLRKWAGNLKSNIRRTSKAARRGDSRARENLAEYQSALKEVTAKLKPLEAEYVQIGKNNKDYYEAWKTTEPQKSSVITEPEQILQTIDEGVDAALSKLDLPERPLNFDFDKPTKAGAVETKPGIPEPDAILNTEPSSKPFQARTVAESDAAITRPVERARDWISKGSSTLVDKVQPLKASSKADEKLLRQTLEVMVERQIQKTGKTPTENSVKRLRSQIITKVGTQPNQKFARLGKIFSSQKKQLAVAREAKDTSLRLPDIEFDMDSVNLEAIPSKIRPQAKEFVRSVVTLADLKGEDLNKIASRATTALAGKDRKAIQEAKGLVDNNISRERNVVTEGAEDYGPIQVLKKDGEVTSIGISAKGRAEIEAGISTGKEAPGFSKPKSLAMNLIKSKNRKNSRFIAALSKKKGKTPEQIKAKFQQLHTQMALVERAAEQGQIDKSQAVDLLGYYSKTWGKIEKSLESSIPNQELRALQIATEKAKSKNEKYGGESQYESKVSYGVSAQQKKSMNILFKKYEKIDKNKNLSPIEKSELKNKASLAYEDILDYDKPIPNNILKHFPLERQLVLTLNRIDSLKAAAQRKNLNPTDMAELQRIEAGVFSQVKSPKEESVQSLMSDANEFGEALNKMDEVEVPTWRGDDDFDLGNVKETGHLDASMAPPEAAAALESAWGINPNQLNMGIPLNLIPGVAKSWMKSIVSNDLISGGLIQGRATLKNIGGQPLINIIYRQQADQQQLVSRTSSAVDKIFAGLKKKEVNAVLQRFSEGKLDGQAEQQLLKISSHLEGLSDKYKVAKSFKKPYDPQVAGDQQRTGTPRENFIDWANYRSQTITRAKHYTNGGSKDISGRNSELAKAIGATTDPKKAGDVVKSIFATRSNSWGQAKIIDLLNTTQFTSYLSLHIIGNFSGNLNILLHGKNNMKAAMQSIFNRKQAKIEAETAGVLGDSSSALFSDIAASKWGKAAAKFTLLSMAEARERTTAAKHGHITAEALWDMFKAGKLNKKGKQQLEDLIFENPENITKLTPTHLRYSRQSFSEITQGGNNPLNMPPLWAGSNAVNLFFIFKKFAYQGNVAMFKAMHRNPKKIIPMAAVLGQILGEAVGDVRATAIGSARGVTEAVKNENKGDLGRLAGAAATVAALHPAGRALKGAKWASRGIKALQTGAGAAGLAQVDEVRQSVKKEIDYRTDRTKFITGSDNPVLNRMVSNYMDAWVTGLFTDTLMSLFKGELSELGGANIDFLSQGVKDTSQLAKGKNPFDDPDSARHWTRRIPFVGSGIAKGMWPTAGQRHGGEGRVVRERRVAE